MAEVQDKSLMARYYRLTKQGEPRCPGAHLLASFDNLRCNFARLCDGGPAQPRRRRTLAISWGAPDELPLVIRINIFQSPQSSSAKESSVIEHAVSLTTHALSHARPAVRGNKPCD